LGCKFRKFWKVLDNGTGQDLETKIVMESLGKFWNLKFWRLKIAVLISRFILFSRSAGLILSMIVAVLN